MRIPGRRPIGVQAGRPLTGGLPGFRACSEVADEAIMFPGLFLRAQAPDHSSAREADETCGSIEIHMSQRCHSLEGSFRHAVCRTECSPMSGESGIQIPRRVYRAPHDFRGLVPDGRTVLTCCRGRSYA